MKFRKSVHAVYRTEYHLVWTPRYSRRVLVGGVEKYLEQMLSHLGGLDDDIEVKKVNVAEEHVHMIVVIPPRLSVSSVVQFLKSRTGKKLKEEFKFMQKAISKDPGIWSRGYCVSGIGLYEKEILRYVEHQEKEDKGQLELDFGI